MQVKYFLSADNWALCTSYSGYTNTYQLQEVRRTYNKEIGSLLFSYTERHKEQSNAYISEILRFAFYKNFPRNREL